MRVVLALFVGVLSLTGQVPVIVPEPNHKSLSEEEGAKAIANNIQQISPADQQLASAMFLKIVAPIALSKSWIVRYPTLIGSPQVMNNLRGSPLSGTNALDQERLARQAAATQVLCAALKGTIQGFGTCTNMPGIPTLKHPAGGAGTDTWRVDLPAVNVPKTEYAQIKLAAGDEVSIEAGGCVQTGVFGPSWKRFVDPQGDGSDYLYHGLIQLPGMPSFARLSDWNNRVFTIPSGSQSTSLWTGYEHDHYWNAGYYGHDNGTGDQCKNVGPAWVELKIKHPNNH
jgi:hypothetical protein